MRSSQNVVLLAFALQVLAVPSAAIPEHSKDGIYLKTDGCFWKRARTATIDKGLRKKMTEMPESKVEGNAIATATVLMGAAGGILGSTLYRHDWLMGKLAGVYNYQLLLSGSYFMFFAAVSTPGRLDQKMGRPTSSDMRFFTPAGWAFAIWGPIFLGEMGMALTALYSTGAPLLQSRGATWLREVAPHYAAAAAYQTLWCAAFRPWAQQSRMLWVPAALLTLAGISLFQAQTVLSRAAGAAGAEGGMTRVGYVLVHVPVAMHFGWISAASLLSWNSYLASTSAGLGVRLAAAIASCYVGAAFLCTTTAARLDPVPAAVGAWALAAVSKGHERLRGVVDEVALDALNYSAAIGSSLCLAVALVTAFRS